MALNPQIFGRPTLFSNPYTNAYHKEQTYLSAVPVRFHAPQSLSSPVADCPCEMSVAPSQHSGLIGTPPQAAIRKKNEEIK
jgi:hypothetical protein